MLTSPQGSQLYLMFAQYNSFGGGSRDPTVMDSATFAKVFRDKGLVSRSLDTSALDIIFTRVKEKGKQRITFKQFAEGVQVVAERLGQPLDALVQHLLETGGPALSQGSLRSHQQPAQGGYEDVGLPRAGGGHRAGGAGDGVPSASSSRQLSRKNSSSSQVMAKAPSGLESEDSGVFLGPLKGSGELKLLKAVFRSYNGFGGKVDLDSMDGRTWIKLLREKGVLSASTSSTDADIIFSKVKTKGLNRISFREFCRGLYLVWEREKSAFHAFPELVAYVVNQGGPEAKGTIAESVPLHDDRRNYTGVYKNGGPSVLDVHTSDLKFITNREVKADVRGVPSPVKQFAVKP